MNEIKLTILIITLVCVLLQGCSNSNNANPTVSANPPISSPSVPSSSLSSSSSTQSLSSSSHALSSSSQSPQETISYPTVIPPDFWRAPINKDLEGKNFLFVEDIRTNTTEIYTNQNSRFSPYSGEPQHAQLAIASYKHPLIEIQGIEISPLKTGFYDSEADPNYSGPIIRARIPGWDYLPCSNPTHKFALDKLQMSDSREILTLQVRFEIYCFQEIQIRGEAHWSQNDTSAPEGPQPPPSDLWQPEDSDTIDDGNISYIFLDSDDGEFVGQGRKFTYTLRDAKIEVNLIEGLETDYGTDYIEVIVYGDQDWNGVFAPMHNIASPQIGYYHLINDNPANGALDWNGWGRACNIDQARAPILNWFSIEEIEISESKEITLLNLTFKQSCQSDPDKTLHGKIYWTNKDTSSPPGPATPPADLWKAPASSTENFAYFEQGFTYNNALNQVFFAEGEELTVEQNFFFPREITLQFTLPNEPRLFIKFEPMEHLDRAIPGYYAGLQRHPFHNPVKGGLEFGIEAQSGCNTLTGWFYIEDISYTADGMIENIKASFEQECGGIVHRGAFSWSGALVN